MAERFYWTPATGLKKDIERHRLDEAELVERLRQLESKPTPTKLQERIKKDMQSALHNFLRDLRQSKAEVVSKIGVGRSSPRN